jgi:hypothetical protein
LRASCLLHRPSSTKALALVISQVGSYGFAWGQLQTMILLPMSSYITIPAYWLRWGGLTNFCPSWPWNHNPPHLHLPSSWDCRLESSCLALKVDFFLSFKKNINLWDIFRLSRDNVHFQYTLARPFDFGKLGTFSWFTNEVDTNSGSRYLDISSRPDTSHLQG